MSVDDFFTRLNPLIAALLRSPFHWLASPGLLLLTVTGRRSGRRYTIPVGYQRIGDSVTVMVSEAPKKTWWRNFREPGDVEVRIRGRQLRGRAVLVAPGSADFREAAERTLKRVSFMGRIWDVDYDARGGLTDAQAAQLDEEIAVLRITLEAPSG